MRGLGEPYDYAAYGSHDYGVLKMYENGVFNCGAGALHAGGAAGSPLQSPGPLKRA